MSEYYGQSKIMTDYNELDKVEISIPEAVVVIPAHNEASTIAGVISGARKALPGALLVVINDGSVDQTADIADDCGALTINLAYNAGYGTALQTGYMYALSIGAKYCLQLDADGQHEPESLTDILAELKKEEEEVIIGARRFSNDSSGYCTTLLRRIGISFFALLSSVITKKRITDSTSGFIGFSNKVLEFLISDYFPGDYPDADVIIMLSRRGFRIKEIKVHMSAGTGKSMHSGLGPVWYVIKMLLSIARAAIMPLPERHDNDYSDLRQKK